MVAFLEDEPAAKKVEEILISALEADTQLMMSVINLGEVWYSIARAHSPGEADTAVDKVVTLGVEILPADWELTHKASQFKARHKIAYADCFAAALAVGQNAELVTGDPEFGQLESEVNIIWL